MTKRKVKLTTDQSVDLLVTDILAAVRVRSSELQDMTLKDLLSLLLALLKFRLSLTKSGVDINPSIEKAIGETEKSLEESVRSKFKVYDNEK